MKKVNIIVPVYADWSSLKDNISSLKRYYRNNNSVNVYYTNDCGPEADFLERKIKSTIRNANNFYYYRNSSNLGFVKNCNNAVENVIDKKGDVLLLNSDTKVTKNFLQEMQRILYSEEKIGIVNPRSNNATVWSVPMDKRFAFEPKRSYKYWDKLKNHIPEKYIAPTSHGFCMLIRRDIIEEIGLFDEIFGKGFGEENDFTMRAGRLGWKCAVANYAFVYHYESRSFGNKQREKLAAENIKIIRKRYPEYDSNISAYLESTNENYNVDSKLWIYYQIIINAINYGHDRGYKTMLKKGAKKLHRKVTKKGKDHKRMPAIIIWAHEITYTGAPTVLFGLLDEWVKKYPDINMKFYVPEGARINPSLLDELRDRGYIFKIIQMEKVSFIKGDTVVLNSSAFPDLLFKKIINGLNENTIKHLYYYAHEDSEKIVNTITKFQNQLASLINKNKVTVYAPSKGALKNWQRFFQTKKNSYVMSGRVRKYDGMLVPKSTKDFDKINFILAGTCEPLKGQLSVVNALSYVNNKILTSQGNFRDFSLVIAGIKDDAIFYNDFVKESVESFKNKVSLVNKPSLSDMHSLISKCNVTISYSLSESFSMITMEGMAYGHPVVRSDTSGREEQLINGKNGWLVPINDFSELVRTLEYILDKEKISNKQLAEMSEVSVEIAKKNIYGSYRLIEDVMSEKQ